MLLVGESSKTGLFRHLSNHVFGVCNFRNTKSPTVISFFQNVQNFWDNCISIFYGEIFCIKNRILVNGSQCVNKKSQDLACQSERQFTTQLPWQWSINIIKLLSCRFQQYYARLPSCLFIRSLKRGFLNMYLTTFSESVISEIQNLWGSSFFSKCSKFNLDFKNL